MIIAKWELACHRLSTSCFLIVIGAIWVHTEMIEIVTSTICDISERFQNWFCLLVELSKFVNSFKAISLKLSVYSFLFLAVHGVVQYSLP